MRNPTRTAGDQAVTAIHSRTTLPPALKAWSIYLHDQGSSVHTVKAFSADLRLLASYLSADQALGAITTRDLNNFLDWMQNERKVPCSPKTLARRITSLKAFFRWLQSKGAILVDPADALVQKSVLSPLPDALTAADMQQVLKAADEMRRTSPPDARTYALASLLLHSGIKKGECLAITPNHIDLLAPGGAILFVRYASPKHRYKERKISLPDSWVEAYAEYRQQYDLSERVFPWSPRRLEYLLEDLGKAAGLEKQLSFLTCRWTCALRDLQGGMDDEKIRQKLGISEIQWREVGMKLERLRTEQAEQPALL